MPQKLMSIRAGMAQCTSVHQPGGLATPIAPRAVVSRTSLALNSHSHRRIGMSVNARNPISHGERNVRPRSSARDSCRKWVIAGCRGETCLAQFTKGDTSVAPTVFAARVVLAGNHPASVEGDPAYPS